MQTLRGICTSPAPYSEFLPHAPHWWPCGRREAFMEDRGGGDPPKPPFGHRVTHTKSRAPRTTSSRLCRAHDLTERSKGPRVTCTFTPTPSRPLGGQIVVRGERRPWKTGRQEGGQHDQTWVSGG